MATQQNTQETVMLERVRLNYFFGFNPYIGKNDQGKETKSYTTHSIMAPNHPGIALIKAAQRKVAAAAWGDQADAVLTQLAAQDKLCLHNGDISKMGKEEYAGKFFVSSNSKLKPRIVVTRGGTNVEIGADDPYAPYSGCWATVMVAVWAQGASGKASQYGKRVNAQLMGVQFLEHDEALTGGGRIAKPEEFGLRPTEADGVAPVASASEASNGLV